MTVGEKIRTAREAKGLTQEELGQILGVQKSAIAKYENGRVVNIKRSKIQALAKALDLNGSDLIDSDPPITKENDDMLSHIIVRMRTDNDFFETVKVLYQSPKNKLKDIRQLLLAFLK